MAGIFQHVIQDDDDLGAQLLVAEVTLVAGAQTVTLPELPAGQLWRVIALAVVAPGAGARGNLSTGVAARVLTVTSDAATEVSTVRVILMRGGGQQIPGA